MQDIFRNRVKEKKAAPARRRDNVIMTEKTTNRPAGKDRYSARRAILRVAFIGVMAAMTFVVTLLRFPFFGSKIHLGNAVCLLSGILLGGLDGGLSAGIGSFLNDMTSGYPLWEALITFASKFLMAFVAGVITRRLRSSDVTLAAPGEKTYRYAPFYVLPVVAAVAGSLTYIAAYVAKHLVLQLFIYQTGTAAAMAVVVSKLPASFINAAASVCVVPPLCYALVPALLHVAGYRRYLTDRER